MITVVVNISVFIMSIAMFTALLRFVKGPTAGDRAVALDTMSVIVIAGLVVLGYVFRRYIYVDLALVYAVLGFIGIIVVARYIEKAL